MLEEYSYCPALDNYTHLDALLLNIERACQAAIDMAMHIVAKLHLGMPQHVAQAFDMLVDAGIVSKTLGRSLRGMVGFRNIAVHDYQKLDQEILLFVVNKGYLDLIEFCRQLGINIHC
jgi:uncharacterized protein YutE (UPF0331/DUF86 family)